MNDDYINNDVNNKKKNIIKIIVITLSILVLLGLIIYFFVIRVKDNNEYLSVNVISKNVNIGNSFNIIARVENNNNPKLEWISNSDSCKVDNGKVTGISKGTCVISVKYKNQEKKVNVYVIDPNSRDQITEFKLVSKSSFDMFVNEVSNIIISIKPDYMLGSVKYSSSDNNICSVDYNGVIKALKSGKCVISCSVDGYSSKLSINVNVKGESYSGEPSIEPEPLPPTPTPSDPEPEPIKPEPDPGENPTPTPTPTPTPVPQPIYAKGGTITTSKCFYSTIEEAIQKPCKVGTKDAIFTFVPDQKDAVYRSFSGTLRSLVGVSGKTRKDISTSYINSILYTDANAFPPSRLDEIFQKGSVNYNLDGYDYNGIFITCVGFKGETSFVNAMCRYAVLNGGRDSHSSI